MLQIVRTGGALSQTDNGRETAEKTKISELANAWQILEDMLHYYTSDEVAAQPAPSAIVRARVPEDEADRVLKEQVGVFQEIVETPSASCDDMVTKLQVWQKTVGGDVDAGHMDTPDLLVLSVLNDLQKLEATSYSAQSASKA